MDPQFYFSVFNSFLASVPNGGLTSFASIMYASFGFTELPVLLVSIPRSVVSILIFVAVGIFTHRVKNMRMWVMAFGTVPACVGILALSLLPNESKYKWIKWGLYLMTVTFSQYLLGHFRDIMSATCEIFRTVDTPRYIPGTIGCSICFGLEFMLIIAWRYYYIRQNKSRDRAAAASGVSAEEQEAIGRDMEPAFQIYAVTELHGN
ncbi:hypothetical protein K438DRAFT_2095782 [Mycena galopus ATCC 62051]|nr:hypothetical protein K438DRAFT_2095782 [Mycena galopus ATCC 62051]